MYPLGFLPFFLALLPESLAVTAAVIVPILALAFWLYAVVSRSSATADDAPVPLPGSSLSHILPFFHRRFDFINSGFQLAGQAIYQFSLLGVRPLSHLQRVGSSPIPFGSASE